MVGADSEGQLQFPTSLRGWIWKIIGLFLTAMGISLGAPFWFELLNRLLRLRGSGPSENPKQVRRSRGRSAPASRRPVRGDEMEAVG